jgi:restriction system protein
LTDAEFEMEDDSALPKRTKELLEEAKRKADHEPVELTVRELLSFWDAKRRGYLIVETIKGDLAAYNLTTDPSFEEAWIDEPVKLVRLPPRAEPKGSSGGTGTSATVDMMAAAGLRVRHLQSANREVSSVAPNASLALAQALMLKDDYSQLAVMSSPRDLRGAVSWKSIAQAQLRDPNCSLRDAVVPAVPVSQEEELLPLIPTIVEKEFLFVTRQDKTLSGIITVADLSLEYNRLARPFFLIGEIERRLRRAIGEVFPLELLQSVRDPSEGSRVVGSVEDLAFGEYKLLLERPENWPKLHWNVDRTVFIKTLDTVRAIRNDVMHFSPDPIEDDQLNVLTNFIGMIKVLDPRP